MVLNRGVINKVTGDKYQAVADFKRAFDLSNEFLPFKNLLVMYFDLGELEAAEKLLSQNAFKQQLNQEEQFELQALAARFIFLQGNFPEAVKKLSALLRGGDDQQLEVLILLIGMCFANDQLGEAASWCDLLVSKFPMLPTSYVFTALLHRKLGNGEKELENYENANSLVDADTPSHTLYELAGGYQGLKLYDKAIPLFERIVNKNVLNEFSRGLIYAYYQSGDLQAAFALADNLYKQNPAHPFLVEIILNIHQEAKQYLKAITVAENFLQNATGYEKDMFNVRGARIYWLNKDPANAKRLILQVAHPQKLPLFEMFRLAWLLVVVDEKQKGLQVAYTARTKFYDRSEAHNDYIQINIRVNKQADEISPAVVAEDCAISVKMESGEEKVFVITNLPAKGENVIRPNDSFAQKLIGKKVGDKFSIGRGYGFVGNITVNGIMDIFTHALHESMALFTTRFAGEHGIGIFHAKPGQPDDEIESFIKSSTIDNYEYEKQAYDVYKQGRATIGVLASSANRNIVRQWMAMVSSADVSIICFTRNESPAASKAMDTKTALIFDPTALLTLFFVVEDNSFLQTLESEILVSQSTVDEFQQAFDDLEHSAKKDILSLSYVDGGMVAHKTPKEAVQLHRETLQRAINWCKDKATLVTPAKLLDIKREEREQMSDLLGESFYDTMLLAEEYQAAIISDDANFKNLLLSKEIPPAFSTYQLSHYLAGKEMLTKEGFDAFRMQLILHNYIFIPVGSEQLWTCFDLAGYKLNKPFTVAVQGFRMMQPQFAATNLAKFLRQLYTDAGLATTREQTTLFVFNSVSARTDFPSFKRWLIIGVHNECRLLPLIETDLLKLLNAF